MSRFLKIVLSLALVAAALMSCGRSARVIPVGKMEKIYREMLLADQWLAENPDKRTMADTTWFYEPIFEKYGFTLKDYQKSVDRYLNDPKRYADMMGRVEKSLRKELGEVNARIAKRDRLQHEADSTARAWKSVKAKSFTSFLDVFERDAMTDRIEFEEDSLIGWRLVPVIEDTIYHGPLLVIRDTTEVSQKDSLFKALPSRFDRVPVSGKQEGKTLVRKVEPASLMAPQKAVKKLELEQVKDVLIDNE